MKMERLFEKTKVGEGIEIDAQPDLISEYYPIHRLIEWLEGRETDGATHVQMDAYAYDSAYANEVEVQAIKIEPESDESYNARLAAESRMKEAKERLFEKREKALYESLKLKYGK